jgi:phosphoglycolate phosphatase-like HAD superfamily hydrolase
MSRYGVESRIDSASFAGATDPERIRRIFQSYDEVKLKILLDEFDAFALESADELIFTSMLPELPNLFNEIAKKVRIGILTGNTETRARLKLEKLGILQFVDIKLMYFSTLEKNKLELARQIKCEWDITYFGDNEIDLHVGRTLKAKTFIINSNFSMPINEPHENVLQQLSHEILLNLINQT